MLRPFQVNEGRFLPLDQDLLPTARSVERDVKVTCQQIRPCTIIVLNYRVSELCSAVKAISNEAEEDQVMLTNEGKQMDPAEMIGAYSVGTVS